MKKIICSNCGKLIQRMAPAKYCFKCAREKQIERGKNNRKKIKGTLSDKCSFCGKKREHIHHADLNRDNNNVSNLLPVCWNCHSRIHSFILRPFIKKIVTTLKQKRYTVIKISEIVGLTRSRIYQIIKSAEVDKQKKNK